MTVYPVAPRMRSNRPDPFPAAFQTLTALAGGAALFVGFLLLLLVGLNVAFAGKIYPGVSMGGVSLAGLTPAAAQARISAQLTFPQNGKIVLQDGGQNWIVRPSDLGVSFDPGLNAQLAYTWGRSGGLFHRLAEQLSAWHSGASISPQLIYDERRAQAYLAQLAAQVDRPTVEATLSLNGTQVQAVPGQTGRRVDQPATLAALGAQIARLGDGVVPLAVIETPPAILDASPAAETARRYLSAPLSLSLPVPQPGDPGPWSIPPEQLAGMLKIEKTQPQGQAAPTYTVGLLDEALNTYLKSLAGVIDRYPENARYIFNDDTRQLELIQSARVGRSLDVAASIAAIQKALAEGQHSLGLSVAQTNPDVGEGLTAEKLGIREQIVAYTSYFRGSTPERLQNIEKAAANFHGLLVAPGATFSMANVMGNVSLDEGYAEAWIIYGGRTIKGVGGGVCQVSTTLFRAAFFAGFPITQRYAHAYRVGYYEQTANGYDPNMAGLDATVFLPLVDFQFVNDSPYWLLMETYYHPNSRSLTWKFYSTSDGRSVEWETSGPQNVVDAPEPTYEENAELAPGQIVQVDWAAEGADVTVLRTVYRAGQALFTDSFVTHYMPWADVFQYGPGTDLPGQNNQKYQPNINP